MKSVSKKSPVKKTAKTIVANKAAAKKKMPAKSGAFDKVGIIAEEMKKAAIKEKAAPKKKVVKGTQDDTGGMNSSGERSDDN